MQRIISRGLAHGDRTVPVTIRLCADIKACADPVHDFTDFILYKNDGRRRTREVCNQRLGF